MAETIRAITLCKDLRRVRAALGACAVALLAATAPLAAAQTEYEVGGTADVGYTRTTSTTQHSSQTFAEARPMLAIQSGSPRLMWRARYEFAGGLTIAGDGGTSYSNDLQLSLASQLGKGTTIVVSGGATQGSTAFQLSQRPPASGEPTLRAPDNPALVTARLGEALALEPSQQVRLLQTLNVLATAPQGALDQYGMTATASFEASRVFPRDEVGGGFRTSYAVLTPLTTGDVRYGNLTNALVGHWNHDFDRRWNGAVTAGIEQNLTFTGSYPLAILPTGSVIARYLGLRGSGALELNFGATTDTLTGTVSQTGSVVVRGLWNLDPLRVRTLGLSAGLLRSEPIGESTTRVAAGTGNAAHADVGLIWSLTDLVLGTVRYTAAYQFDQPGGLEPSLIHVLLVGITVRYSNMRYATGAPSFGGRVDRTDAVGVSGGGDQKGHE